MRGAQQRGAVRERNFREALELLRAVDALGRSEAAAHQRAWQLRASQALQARCRPAHCGTRTRTAQDRPRLVSGCAWKRRLPMWRRKGWQS